MSKYIWLFKRLLLPVLLVIMLMVIAGGFTKASFSDTETSYNSTAGAWTSTNWTQSTQSDFQADTLNNVSTTLIPNNVKLNLNGSTVAITKSPNTNTSSFWSNANYADNASDGTCANITSGTPSGNDTWQDYWFSSAADNISQVRVRYDAYSAPPGSITKRSTSSASGTSSLTLSAPSGIATNDIMLAFIVDRYTTADTASSPPTNGGWTNRGHTALTNGNGGRFQVFSAVRGASNYEASWQWTGLTSPSYGVIIGYYNADITGGTVQIDNNTVSVRSNSAGTHGTTGITSSTANCTIVAAFAEYRNASTWTSEQCATIGTLSEESDGNNPGNLSIAIADKQLVTPGSTGNSNATPSNDNKGNGGILLALKPDVSMPQIRVNASWDGGAHWTSQQSTTLTTTKTAYYYNITGATSWNTGNLANGQLLVRADSWTVQIPKMVYLDWLPVEVTYRQYYDSGTLISKVQDTNVTGSRWDAIFWNDTLPAGTNITLAVRASADNITWPAWQYIGSVSPVTTGLPSGRYKQWMATLTADSANITSPVLINVRTYYDGG